MLRADRDAPWRVGFGLSGLVRGVRVFAAACTAAQVRANMFGAPAPVNAFDFTRTPPVDTVPAPPGALTLSGGARIVTCTPAVQLAGPGVNPAGRRADPYTVQAWVYLASSEPPGQAIFSNGEPHSDEGMTFIVNRPDTGGSELWSLRGSIDGERELLATRRCPTGRWVNVATTFDGTRLALYIDGQPAGQSGPLLSVPRSRMRGATMIGGAADEDDPLVNWTIQGWVARLDVWRKALAAQDVRRSPTPRRTRRPPGWRRPTTSRSTRPATPSTACGMPGARAGPAGRDPVRLGRHRCRRRRARPALRPAHARRRLDQDEPRRERRRLRDPDGAGAQAQGPRQARHRRPDAARRDGPGRRRRTARRDRADPGADRQRRLGPRVGADRADEQHAGDRRRARCRRDVELDVAGSPAGDRDTAGDDEAPDLRHPGAARLALDAAARVRRDPAALDRGAGVRLPPGAGTDHVREPARSEPVRVDAVGRRDARSPLHLQRGPVHREHELGDPLRRRVQLPRGRVDRRRRVRRPRLRRVHEDRPRAESVGHRTPARRTRRSFRRTPGCS